MDGDTHLPEVFLLFFFITIVFEGVWSWSDEPMLAKENSLIE
jgi:hypothetical protein